MASSVRNARSMADQSAAHTSLARTCCPLVAALRARRQVLGLSQYAVADRIGVHHYLVGWWECGRRTPNMFMAMAWAEALDCRLLLLLIDHPPTPLRDRARIEGGGQKPAASRRPDCQPDFCGPGVDS